MDIVLVIIFFSLRPWLGLSYSPHLWQISIQLCEEKQTPLNLTLSRGKVGDESRYAHKGAGGGGWMKWNWPFNFLFTTRMSCSEGKPFNSSKGWRRWVRGISSLLWLFQQNAGTCTPGQNLSHNFILGYFL